MYTTNNNILNIAKYSVVTSPHSYQKPAIQDNVKGEVSRGFSTFVMKMVQLNTFTWLQKILEHQEKNQVNSC